MGLFFMVRLGWAGDTGGWGPERLPGFEDDMTCDSIDQYYAEEITGEEIYAKYIARNAPVLIRGLLKDWKVIQTFLTFTETFPIRFQCNFLCIWNRRCKTTEKINFFLIIGIFPSRFEPVQ